MAQSEQEYPWETPPEIWRGFKCSTVNWQASVVAIFITPRAAEEMVSVPQVRAFVAKVNNLP